MRRRLQAQGGELKKRHGGDRAEEPGDGRGKRERDAPNGRRRRRLAGVLAKRLPDAGLAQVDDPRHGTGRRWSLSAILTGVMAAMLAGCRSLAEMEAATAEMSLPIRKLLGLKRRLPDTTVRSLLIKLVPDELRQCIYRQIRAAYRRKALRPEGVPFGVASMDGKVTAIDENDQRLAQRVRRKDGSTYGLVRTITTVLSSTRARPCLDAAPIPPHTNEMGHFIDAVIALMNAYPASLFRLITYDAGACAFVNARFIAEETPYDYMFRLGNQPKLLALAEKLLGSPASPRVPDKVVKERRSGDRVRYELFTGVCGPLESKKWHRLCRARTFVRVQRTVRRHDGKTTVGNRYWVTSLEGETLSPEQWLRVARGHWGVENNAHNTLDRIFAEDARPWITSDPQGTVALMLLRRMTYNILTLYRAVTTRSKENRTMPWRALLRGFFITLVAATEKQLEGFLEVKHPAPHAA